jgi:hypothetical protein
MKGKQIVGVIVFSIIWVGVSYYLNKNVFSYDYQVGWTKSLQPIYIQEFNANQFQFSIYYLFATQVILILLLLAYNKRWLALGISVLLLAWELTGFILSNYFYKIDDYDFNTDLFVAISLTGVAIVLFLIGALLLRKSM